MSNADPQKQALAAASASTTPLGMTNWVGRDSVEPIPEERSLDRVSPYHRGEQLAKFPESYLFPASQRVFEIVALLVPGLASLDVKLYSPGVTQRKEFSDLMIF